MNNFNKVAHNPDEILSIIDEQNNEIGTASRKKIHEKGLRHREVYLFVLDIKKRVLLQQRLDNRKWIASVTGHFPNTQNYEEAAIREAEEEIGISLKESDLTEVEEKEFFGENSSKKNLRIIKAFTTNKGLSKDKYIIDKGEVKDIKYFTKKQIEELLQTNSIGNIAKELLEKFILDKLA